MHPTTPTPKGSYASSSPRPAKDGGVIKYATAYGKPSLIDLLHYKRRWRDRVDH